VLSQGHLMDLLGKLMMLGASMISGLLLRDWLRRTFGFQLDAGVLPLPLQIVIYFFVYSFFDYWTHRVDHTRYFWPLHRYHHAARDFCVITGGREHPAAFVSIFLINLPMAALGATPEAMIYVNVVVTVLGFVIHSRIDSGFGWVGRYVIQSPNHHRLHHKLDMSHPTGHFSMAPVWDHLFGTWYGDADQSLAIGVDTPYRHGFWIGADLVRDYWDFWKGLFQRRAGG
jgi:sterol desaturase/sphingolipid hydroxylase (fatty acid hydroxylase superfamily)